MGKKFVGDEKLGSVSSRQINKLLAEFVGTFALTFAGTGAIIVNEISHGEIGNLGIAIAFGLVVTIMVYIFGDISGAHINPAVTIGFVAARQFSIKQVPGYWLAQFSGAISASALLHTLFGNIAHLGATIPNSSIAVSFTLEVILGFFLMLVIVAVVAGTEKIGGMASVAIGGIIALGSIFAGPISGASMNPARSFAPALVSGYLEFNWIYWLAPIIGAVLGALFYRQIEA